MPGEYPFLRDQILFTYLHLAAEPDQTAGLIDSGCTAIAYETVELPNGELPLLTPMSEVAGRMATQEGAKYLEMPQGGHGILLGGVPGVEPATVVVIGGGLSEVAKLINPARQKVKKLKNLTRRCQVFGLVQ